MNLKKLTWFDSDYLIALVCASFCLYFVACKTEEKFRRQENKAQTAANKVNDKQDEIAEKGKAYLYGTGVALGRSTNSEPAVQVAKDFNNKAQVILGPPTVDDATKVTAIINDLLSQLKEQQEVGRLQEAKFLEGISLKHKELDLLKEKSDAALKSVQELAEKNSVKAQKWDEYQEKHWLRRIFASLGIVGTIAAIVALCVFVPAAIPILARIVAFIVAKLPSLAGAVGVVSTKAFDGVVKGVGELRSRLKTAPDSKTYTKDEVLNLVDTNLHKNLDSDHKELINSRRTATQADKIP